MTPLFLPPQLELRPFRIWRKPLSATQSPPTPSSSPQGAGDERIQQVSFISRLLSRPEFGALVGAILVFIAFSIFSWDAKDNFPDFLKLQAVVIWLKFASGMGWEESVQKGFLAFLVPLAIKFVSATLAGHFLRKPLKLS